MACDEAGRSDKKSAEITRLTAELTEANRKLELMPALVEGCKLLIELDDEAGVIPPLPTQQTIVVADAREAIAAIDRAREEKP